MLHRVPEPGSRGVCRAESAAADEEAAARPLPQSQEPGVQPEAAAAADAAGWAAAEQDGREQPGEGSVTQNASEEFTCETR